MSQLKIKDGNSWVNIPSSGIGIPSGGSSGQFLKKSSSTDYATEWANINMPQTTILTPIVTKTSGNVSITGASAVRYGNVIQFDLRFHFTGTVNAGSNALEATVSDIPLPILDTRGATYFSGSGLIAALTPSGTLTVRVISQNRTSSNTETGVSVTYICN